MAGNKIFYVTRTEDEATQTAGAATNTRADKPQLLKIVGVDHAGNPNPATPEDNQIYATEEENQEILLTSDTVQAGDLNPVTSDAVATYIANQLELSDYEDITISTNSASPTVMQYDGFIYIGTRYSADLYINATSFLISVHDGTPGGGACMVAVRKGDKVYIHSSNKEITERVAYYKLRDYSKRT